MDGQPSRQRTARMFPWVHLGLGNLDAVFHWLNRAVDERDPHILHLPSKPIYDPIREDPRFHILLHRMRLASELLFRNEEAAVAYRATMRFSLLLTAILACILPAAAEVHKIYPNHHSRNLSAQKEPILRIRSGDRVVTKTWDSGGGDEHGVHHLQHPYVPPEGGNPLFGPFYVEGAEPGDALEVRLDKVRVNRNYGYTTTGIPDSRLNAGDSANSRPKAYEMHAVRPKRDDLIPWDIDRQKLTTSPRLRPSMRSDWKIEIPVRPHLGTIGVAEPGVANEPYSPTSTHGGNMDYNDTVEGATLYFPVYHRGAYLYLGDGHALQGDGEGFGAGVETSLDVEFTVRIVKNKNLTGPRLVNSRYIASIVNNPSKESNTDSRLREGSSDMLRWLREECGLTLWESHMLMGSVVEHKIGTYWTTTVTLIPRQHVPARCHQLQDTVPEKQ